MTDMGLAELLPRPSRRPRHAAARTEAENLFLRHQLSIALRRGRLVLDYAAATMFFQQRADVLNENDARSSCSVARRRRGWHERAAVTMAGWLAGG